MSDRDTVREQLAREYPESNSAALEAMTEIVSEIPALVATLASDKPSNPAEATALDRLNLLCRAEDECHSPAPAPPITDPTVRLLLEAMERKAAVLHETVGRSALIALLKVAVPSQT